MVPRISYCEGVAVVQAALAVGFLALGQPTVAAAFGVFALVHVVTLVAQRCFGGSCRTNFIDPRIPQQ